jgi:hypothetical protein
MIGDYHVRFCEGLGVKFPWSTRRARRMQSGDDLIGSILKFNISPVLSALSAPQRY